MIYLWCVGVRGCVEVPSLYVLGDKTLLSKEVESKALLRFSHIRVNLLFLLCRGFFHIRLSLLCRGFFHIRLILFLLLCRREKRRAGGEKGKEEMEGRKGRRKGRKKWRGEREGEGKEEMEGRKGKGEREGRKGGEEGRGGREGRKD